jgi:hypothetical protein
MLSRREFNLLTGAGLLLTGSGSSIVFAKSKPRADKVLWGGLGFSVKEAEIDSRLPFVSQAFVNLGYKNVVTGFTDLLEKKYPGGVEEDPKGLLDANSDPLLIFMVSVDYEQMILIPTDMSEIGDKSSKENLETQISYIYAQAQVIFFDLPRQGGSDGELRILYSLPFRVKSIVPHLANDKAKRLSHFKDLVHNLTETFGTEIASASFRDAGLLKKLKVNSVSISPDAEATIKELGIEKIFDQNFLGQAFSASLAEHGGLSVLPYMATNSFGTLQQRYNKYPDISKVFERFSKIDELDYTIDLTVHKALRKSNGGNAANVLYSRGLSVFVKLTDTISKKVIFDKKILLIESNELPKSMFDRLQDFDMRYLVQISIKLFDEFVAGVMSEDKEKLKSVGIDISKDMGDIKALKTALLQCKHKKD